jgi:hypothetical protein
MVSASPHTLSQISSLTPQFSFKTSKIFYGCCWIVCEVITEGWVMIGQVKIPISKTTKGFLPFLAFQPLFCLLTSLNQFTNLRSC